MIARARCRGRAAGLAIAVAAATAVAAVAGGCLTPRRIRWLGDGFYTPEELGPPVPAAGCRVPVRAAGRAAPGSADATAASAPAAAAAAASGAESAAGAAAGAGVLPGAYEVEVGGALGKVTVGVYAPGASAGAALWVPPRAARPLRVAEERAWNEVVPGFVFGVDLRGYASVAFVVDLSSATCDDVSTYVPGKATIDRIEEQLSAAIAGLPEATRLTLVGAGGAVYTLVPEPTAAGRRAAVEWACGLFCNAEASLTLGLVRAFAEEPEVVVLLSTGATWTPADRDPAKHVAVPPALLYADPLDALPRMEAVRPVIAVSFAAPSAASGVTRMLRIAELTGGAYVARPTR